MTQNYFKPPTGFEFNESNGQRAINFYWNWITMVGVNEVIGCWNSTQYLIEKESKRRVSMRNVWTSKRNFPWLVTENYDSPVFDYMDIKRVFIESELPKEQPPNDRQ